MKHNEYQSILFESLSKIFGKELVENEWDSVKNDTHTYNHELVYAPRHDIAVGPFNTYFDLDVGNDKTEPMQSHPFTQSLYKHFLKDRETLPNVWNPISRCYMAIEIEFSGSSKHMLGGMLNASVTGAIGIVIVKQPDMDKALRISGYLMRLNDFGKLNLNMLRNLIIFDVDDFSGFLSNFN